MNKEYMPLAVAVFLVVAGLLFGVLSLPQNGVVEGKSNLGVAFIPSALGAEVNNNAALNVQDASFFAATNKGAMVGGSGEMDTSYSNNSAMVQDKGASLASPASRSQVINYIVQKSDTLASIASYFGISKVTILAANANLQSGAVRSGEVIKILPVSGVLYEAEVGDTLSSIANIFNVSQNDLLQYNPSIDFSSLAAGAFVVIPNDGAARAVLAAESNL